MALYEIEKMILMYIVENFEKTHHHKPLKL